MECFRLHHPHQQLVHQVEEATRKLPVPQQQEATMIKQLLQLEEEKSMREDKPSD